MLGHTWHHAGTHVAPCWDTCGTMLGHMWHHAGTHVAPYWDTCGWWHPTGTHVAPYWDSTEYTCVILLGHNMWPVAPYWGTCGTLLGHMWHPTGHVCHPTGQWAHVAPCCDRCGIVAPYTPILGHVRGYPLANLGHPIGTGQPKINSTPYSIELRHIMRSLHAECVC